MNLLCGVSISQGVNHWDGGSRWIMTGHLNALVTWQEKHYGKQAMILS
jgi:hypothetical protein